MAGEVVVDALPYIDQGYDDPGIREAALAMVDEECRRYRPTKNYLEQLPPSATVPSSATFETPLLRRELERLNARLPPEPLSMKRYELPPPVAGRLSDATAWIEAVDNSHAQLEHQATRVMNLELQLDYACETWRAYLEIINKMVAGAQNRLAALRKETASVNWERKSVQTAIGSKLRGFEQAWVQLVSHNYSLERAIAEMENQLSQAQNKSKEGAQIETQPELPTETNNTQKMAEMITESTLDVAKKQLRRAEEQDVEEDNDPPKKKKAVQKEDIFAE